MAPALTAVPRAAWRGQRVSEGERHVPEEAPVAFTYEGGAYAVMMATPQDLQDFAIGFSLTEGVVASPAEITDLQVIEQAQGIELRMWLVPPRAQAWRERRRHLAGPTGCGLCGLESLAEAVRPPRRVTAGRAFTVAEVMRALDALPARQELFHQTRAVHAAGFWEPGAGLFAVREDVGRHNALDKLAGALAAGGVNGQSGIVVVTSRVSVEMVQKAAAMDVPVLIAVSAPTALAIRTAEAAGITLIAVARGDGFEVFTHAQRLLPEATIEEPQVHVA